MRRRTSTALAALLIVGSVVAVAAPAAAEPPLRLSTQVTDQVGALTGEEPQVDDALEQLRTEDQQQLWVVYVDSFDGVSGEEWAQQTFAASGFGGDDVLLAVAVTDRAYAYHVADSSPLSDEAVTEVSRDTEAELADGDWSGAAVAGAQSIGDELGGSGSSGAGLLVLVLVVLVLLGVVVALVLRARRRRGGGSGGAAGPADPYAGTSTDDLRTRADATLVHADDAVRTSSQELEFARAEFGDEATQPFSAALATAREALTAAFRQRQLLDDDQRESDTETRTLLAGILRSCEQAGQALDAESGRLAELRDLLATAPQRLDTVAARLPSIEAQVEPARAELVRLAARFSPTALTSVATNPDEASRRTATARGAVDAGRAALAQTTEGDAVVDAVRTAEEATAQATQLLDAVGRAGADLDRATAELPAALLRLRTDLDTLGADGNVRDLAQAAAAARAAVSAGEETGGLDPLGALHRVAEADRTLDAAVEARQAAAREQQQLQALLEQTLLGAHAEVDAAEDFIATRRGAVGGTARTRLAEAQRHLERAEALRSTDAAAALEHARTADSLAERASTSARADVDRFSGGGGYGGGGYGGSGGNVGGEALLGAVLGGILSGGGGRRQGGWGGGSFGGGGFGGGGGRSSGGSFGGGGGGGRSAGGRF